MIMTSSEFDIHQVLCPVQQYYNTLKSPETFPSRCFIPNRPRREKKFWPISLSVPCLYLYNYADLNLATSYSVAPGLSRISVTGVMSSW